MPEKKNSSNWKAIKNILLSDFYEFTHNVMVIQRDKIKNRPREYRDTVDKLRNTALSMRTWGGGSRNISFKGCLMLESLTTHEEIKGTLKQEDEDEGGEEIRVDYRIYDPDAFPEEKKDEIHQQNKERLQTLVFRITDDMRNTGFLDTRFNVEEKVSLADQLDDKYHNNPVLERMLDGASKEEVTK